MFDLNQVTIGVIGLGYVGLPLAVEFGRLFPTHGFDINQQRITELSGGHDSTLECSTAELQAATQLSCSSDLNSLAGCNVYIISVPTPIDGLKRPDFSPLINSSCMIAPLLRSGDLVIYESTVYPGATEEVCIPVLEHHSGLRCLLGTEDPAATAMEGHFFVGYSPERINPGDKQHRLTTICKVTSGSTPAAAAFVDQLYNTIITAGTFRASSIRVAEAAKVIENTQRDVNIALMNELAQIFERAGIDTLDVLEAAGTKWNFLPFRPGLVGGHCIGVDPYYLVHKAQELGYQPTVIPASRLLNDSMGEYVAGRLIKLMARRGISAVGGRILILGLSFKENCPDLRNTRVIDIINELRIYNANIDIYDPWVDAAEAKRELGIELTPQPQQGLYDAVLIAVAHQQFKAMGAAAIRRFGREGAALFDIKSLFSRTEVDDRL